MNGPYFYKILGYTITSFFFLNINYFKKIKLSKLFYDKKNLYKNFNAILFCLTFFFICLLISLNLDIFNRFFSPIDDLYFFRDQQTSRFNSYVIPLLSNTLLTYLLLEALRNKNLLIIPFILFLFYLVFLIESKKYILFLPLFIFVLNTILSKFKNIVSIIFVFIVLIFFLYIIKSSLLLSFDNYYSFFIFDQLIRRILIVPSIVNEYYFEFVENYKSFFNYSENSYALTIGHFFYPDKNVNMTANFFTSSYFFFKFYGILFSSVFFGALISFIDNNVRNKTYAIVFFAPAFIAGPLNTNLYTSFLSHGLLSSIIFFLYIRNLRF